MHMLAAVETREDFSHSTLADLCIRLARAIGS